MALFRVPYYLITISRQAHFLHFILQLHFLNSYTLYSSKDVYIVYYIVTTYNQSPVLLYYFPEKWLSCAAPVLK